MVIVKSKTIIGRWFSLFSPIGLILFGLYLRKDGVLVKNFAFRDVSDELYDSKQIFETGLGLLGVFVITSTISFVLSILITSLEKIRRVVGSRELLLSVGAG